MRRHGNDLILGTMANGHPVRLSREQRGTHLYTVGASGTGKSKFLESLIRQDIMNWPRSRCGMIVIDKHGALFDSTMGWVAANGFRHMPIVPIDLRRSDWVVSYNVLRRRPLGNPAAIVGGLARAIVHAWGQGNMDDTPRLAKWLPIILSTLYEKGHTLVDALHLFGSADLRRAMTADLENFVARSVWKSADTLRPAEFHEEVSSTINRLLRFLSTQVMRAMLCQTESSLDLGQAVDRGAILLVCLATAGSQVDSEDARTIGSLLLSDLWTAAQVRGKRDEGARGVKPFYCYIDEFQEYLTPSIAESLDQARGFGLHFTLAHQYPSQLTRRGELGKLIFDSVMANARSKVVFQLEHPEDLPTLALWLGRQHVDLNEIKHQHHSTKVMGYTIEYLRSFGSSTADTAGTSESTGESTGQNHSVGSNWGHTDSRSSTHTSGESFTEAQGESAGMSSGMSEGQSQGLAPDDGEVLREGQAVGWSAGESSSRSKSFATTKSHSESRGVGSADARGGSESRGTSSSRTLGRGSSRSKGQTESVNRSPMLIPIIGSEASSPQFRSIEEQMFRFMQMMAALPKRNAVVRVVDSNFAVAMVTQDVLKGLTTLRHIERWTITRLEKIPYALPMADALKKLEDREATFPQKFLAPSSALEPMTFKRKVNAKILPPPPQRPFDP